MEESKKQQGRRKKLGGNLISALDMYGHSDYYPFHMPGHKRNPDFMTMPPVYRTDITEIDGFDNLHHARGILLKSPGTGSPRAGSRGPGLLLMEAPVAFWQRCSPVQAGGKHSRGPQWPQGCI